MSIADIATYSTTLVPPRPIKRRPGVPTWHDLVIERPQLRRLLAVAQQLESGDWRGFERGCKGPLKNIFHPGDVAWEVAHRRLLEGFELEGRR